jgi:hypothetical protein
MIPARYLGERLYKPGYQLGIQESYTDPDTSQASMRLDRPGYQPGIQEEN